jgi:antitoxin ParD1/3/4
MVSMNVSLPEPMKRWAEDRVASGRYANVSDYVRDLIRQDQDAQAKLATLREALIEGENSGPSERTVERVFADARRKARARPGNG